MKLNDLPPQHDDGPEGGEEDAGDHLAKKGDFSCDLLNAIQLGKRDRFFFLPAALRIASSPIPSP